MRWPWDRPTVEQTSSFLSPMYIKIWERHFTAFAVSQKKNTTWCGWAFKWGLRKAWDKKKKNEDTANPIKTALEKCLEVLHLSGTEWNQSDAPHSPRAAGWQQPRSFSASVKCQQLIKEHRAACGIRMHSRRKVNFTEVYFKEAANRKQNLY